MSDELPSKVRSQLVLAYAFGIIGVLSSAYVYWDEQKNIKEIKDKYSNNLIVDSLTIKKGSGFVETKIDNYGIKTNSDLTTIYMGINGVRVNSNLKDDHSKVLPLSTYMTADEFSAQRGQDEEITKISAADISLERKMYSGDISGARVGNVTDVNSIALGFTSYIKDKDKDSSGFTIVKRESQISPSNISIFEGDYARASMGVQSLTNINTGGSETTPPSTIMLYDKNGKTLYRLPVY